MWTDSSAIIKWHKHCLVKYSNTEKIPRDNQNTFKKDTMSLLHAVAVWLTGAAAVIVG